MTTTARSGPPHAFVDESKRGPYLMCAFVAAPASRKSVVGELNRLRAPKASRLHMKNESERTKRAVLSALRDLGVTSTVYRSRVRPFHSARAAIIEHGIWPQVLREGIERLVLEPEVGQDDRDRRLLYRLAASSGRTGRISYIHVPPALEPMLWVPDAIAWAYGSGGEWRRRALDVIDDVLDVDRIHGAASEP